MTPRVIEARYVDDYVIWLRFDDGRGKMKQVLRLNFYMIMLRIRIIE